MIDAECIQDFSDDEVSYESQVSRFRFYCQGAKNIEKDGLWDKIQYTAVVLMRALRLSFRYRKAFFLIIFFTSFLK